MAADGRAEFNLRVEADDAEAVDEATRQLWRELGDIDDVSITAAPGEAAPDGAKGDALTNALVVSAFSTSMTAVVNYVNAWVQTRRTRCTVVIEHANGRIEFPGARPEDVNALLDRFNSPKTDRS